MFSLALIIGIYSYSIFLIGLLFLLKPSIIVLFSILFFAVLILSYRKNINVKDIYARGMRVSLKKLDKFLLILLTIQVGVNLVGALGPELAFDALWYHLTFPKLYLEYGGIVHVPGGLLYYSGIPKLTELIYTAQLAFGGEIIPKLTHLTFGLLTCIALYKISRKYLSITYSILVVLLFYSNLSVAWESITAYVDLARAFFEIMAFWAFLNWHKDHKLKWFLLSSVILGLAISSKLISMSTIPIYLVLIFLQNINLSKKIKLSIFFTLLSLFIASPWFVFSFIHTGNPIYPLISNYDTGQGFFLLNPIRFAQSLFNLFTKAADPISPIYIITFPLLLFFFRKIYYSKLKTVLIFSSLSLLVWYITPQSGGGRFILPFLPMLSLLSVAAVTLIERRSIRRYLTFLVIFLSIVSIGYRGIANLKYAPLLLGKETKEEFMTKNLNFSFGDFYDIDNYFKDNLNEEDTVLLYGFHNLYYVDFNFIHESWVKKGDTFNYIATQDAKLPERFSLWNLIYYNPTTNVRLYSLGGQEWVY